MLFFNGRVSVDVGDITAFDVDAIVNAANSTLFGGGGVDGAIHKAGGSKILDECKLIRKTQYPDGLPAGLAVPTSGGNLKARWIIHTVGPIWQDGKNDEEKLLALAYKNSIAVAETLRVKSMAIPAISTGAYGFPKKLAAQLVGKVLNEYYLTASDLELIHLVFFSKQDADTFIKYSGLS